MKAEDQRFITTEDVWITREGNGIVEARHLKSEKDYEYYKVVGLETRYVIYKCNGRQFLPSLLYERLLSDEASFAASVVKPTRKYKREIDRTWFKYYDDAEEVLKNINNFILWCRKIPSLNIKNVLKKKLINKTSDLLRDETDTQEISLIRISANGINIKNRSDLKPLARDLADELDLEKLD